jgi:hypothetical protein
MQGLPNNTIEKINEALREKENLDKQSNMINDILSKEKDKKTEELQTARIHITGKIFPPLFMAAESVVKNIEEIKSATTYYYDLETKFIEEKKYTSSR